MIINGVKQFNNLRNLSLNPKKKNTYAQRPISSADVLDFMKFTSISFMGEKKPTFEETISENYFQLPKIKTKNGNIVQAMPDKTQMACARSLYDGKSTVCIAPTGTGKTAIANYVITKNLKENKKTVYTTPLKALSNDKYREFCKIYGKENVGILTGDIKLNHEAPVLIMTTEIYRNMALGAYAKNNEERFEDIKTVIFDEAHYVSEPERGKIWEESIMLTPKNVQILPLSATIGNGKEFSSWIEKVSEQPVNLVEASPKDRHVPLVYYNYEGNQSNHLQEIIKGNVDINLVEDNFDNNVPSQRQIRAIDMLVQLKYNQDDDYSATEEERKIVLDELRKMTGGQKTEHKDFSKRLRQKYNLSEIKSQEITQLLLDSSSRKINNFNQSTSKQRGKKNDYKDLVNCLKKADKLPALVFVFSRANCNESTSILADSDLKLTSQKEKDEIRKIIKSYKDKKIWLGRNFFEEELVQGVAKHHAGLLPSYKKLVEELFSKKLVKVVFATSTLSAGINMPAKTVVITAIDKPTRNDINEVQYVPLSSNEFHQMSGRAGRRGIDTIGNVVLYNLNNADSLTAKKLILDSPDNAESAFSPSYSFLTAYYQKCEDDKLLEFFEKNTLKLYQSHNKEKDFQELKEEFEKYKKVLTDLNFLMKTKDGYRPTQKGEILTKVHGYNQLALVKLLDSGKLSKLNPVELASFAAAMTSEETDNKDKDNDDNYFRKCLFEESVNEEKKSPIVNIIDEAMWFDDKKCKVEKNAGIDLKKGYRTGVIEAYIAYNWAKNNSENPYSSIKHFRDLGKDFIGKNARKAQISTNVRRNFEDGRIYGILAQSVDVIKQIINICEFKIENNAQDIRQYETLLRNAQHALELIAQPPIYDALAIQ